MVGRIAGPRQPAYATLPPAIEGASALAESKLGKWVFQEQICLLFVRAKTHTVTGDASLMLELYWDVKSFGC